MSCALCRFERFEVLVVFASTILAQFGALFIVKERSAYCSGVASYVNDLLNIIFGFYFQFFCDKFNFKILKSLSFVCFSDWEL